jgi:nitrogen fixation NifU-like protein
MGSQEDFGMNEDDFYREHILDHFRNPRNVGRLQPADVSHEEDNPLCGDRIRVDLQIQAGVVKAVAWEGRGCAISQASASLLSERLAGRSLEEIKQIDKAEVLEDLGIAVSPARLKCALLALSALQVGLWGQAAHDAPGDD